MIDRSIIGELIVSTREPEVETFVPLVHMSQESTQMFLVTNQSDFGARSKYIFFLNIAVDAPTVYCN